MTELPNEHCSPEKESGTETLTPRKRLLPIQIKSVTNLEKSRVKKCDKGAYDREELSVWTMNPSVTVFKYRSKDAAKI